MLHHEFCQRVIPQKDKVGEMMPVTTMSMNDTWADKADFNR